MGSIDKRPLRAFVRFDGSGRIVAGSLILRRKKPKVGKWKEISAYECCNPVIPPADNNCGTYTISVGEETIDVTYFDCNGELVEDTFIGPSVTTICSRIGSVEVTGETTEVTLEGPCPLPTTSTTTTLSPR